MKYLSNNIFWPQLSFSSKFIPHFWSNFASKFEIFSWKISNFLMKCLILCLWPIIVISDFLCEIIPTADQQYRHVSRYGQFLLGSCRFWVVASSTCLKSSLSRLSLRIFYWKKNIGFSILFLETLARNRVLIPAEGLREYKECALLRAS